MSTGFWVSYGLLWALTVFLAFLLLGIVNSVFGRTNAEASGPTDTAHYPEPIGKQAPEIAATDLDGKLVSSGDWSGRRSALLWVSPDCLSCKLTLPELAALHQKVNGNLIVVCRSARGRCAQMAEEYGLSVPVLVDEDDRVSKQFGIDIAPTAVIISADGTIETIGHPLSGDDLERLMLSRNGNSAGGTAGPTVIDAGE